MNQNQIITVIDTNEDPCPEGRDPQQQTETQIRVLDDAFLAYVGGGTGVGNMQ